jgi:hypothetical protein
MSIGRERAMALVNSLLRRNEDAQKEIDEWMEIRAAWSDLADPAIALLNHDISSRKRSIARLEEKFNE